MEEGEVRWEESMLFILVCENIGAHSISLLEPARYIANLALIPWAGSRGIRGRIPLQGALFHRSMAAMKNEMVK